MTITCFHGSTGIRHVDILGTKICELNPNLFLQLLASHLDRKSARGSGCFVVFRDVHGVIRAREEIALAAAHDSSLMTAPDGVPLVWVARALGLKDVARVCGPDMMLKVCDAGLAKGWRHFLYGGSLDVLRDLERALKRNFPRLQIVGMLSPPFCTIAAVEQESILQQLRDAKPDIVWVGLGTPKQEIWMAQYASQIPNAICMGVGAAFDIHAGRRKRAPVWLRDSGCEWIYRIRQEPVRLAKRYATTVPRFLVLIAFTLLRRELAPLGISAVESLRRNNVTRHLTSRAASWRNLTERFHVAFGHRDAGQGQSRRGDD